MQHLRGFENLGNKQFIFADKSSVDFSHTHMALWKL